MISNKSFLTPKSKRLKRFPELKEEDLVSGLNGIFGCKATHQDLSRISGISLKDISNMYSFLVSQKLITLREECSSCSIKNLKFDSVCPVEVSHLRENILFCMETK